jgi:hypothetical protein
MGRNVLVPKPENHVYEEVVKPFLEKLKPHSEPSFPSLLIPNLPLEKRARINLDYE